MERIKQSIANDEMSATEFEAAMGGFQDQLAARIEDSQAFLGGKDKSKLMDRPAVVRPGPQQQPGGSPDAKAIAQQLFDQFNKGAP